MKMHRFISGLKCQSCGKAPRDFDGVVAFTISSPILCEECLDRVDKGIRKDWGYSA